jgi:hypothetical protein
VLSKREENEFLVFGRKVLRTICGPKQENGVRRRSNNFELERECYAGHMIRRPEDLPMKAIFLSKIARNETVWKTEVQVGGWRQR